MKLRQAIEADIAWIMALERRPENSAYVSVNDVAGHQAFIAAPDSATLVLEGDSQPLGFAILRGLTTDAAEADGLRFRSVVCIVGWR